MPPTQANRPLRVTTPLGPDKLLPAEFGGTEALSELFKFSLTLLAENATQVAFDKLIGQPILVEMDLPGGKKRHFHGICNRLSEGKRDADFTRYRMEIVPKFWLLTRRCQSRIFQQNTIPDLLKEVLKGLDVKWDLKGKYPERDYVVQYRESDFNFASRLMEEEGIYYYFTHSDKGHTMVVADTPDGHAEVPVAAKAIYEDVRGGSREDMRVTEWEKVQELGSGKVTLWDHCFEMPQQNLEAQKTIQESVAVGKVTHKLKVADNDQLEVFDYPGAFSEWFDGVDPGGGEQPAQLEKIFAENARITKIRMEQEAAVALEVRGGGNCRQFTSGHKLTLERHFNADGAYVLTGVTHTARLAADYRSGEGESLTYENEFRCIPLALPFRPAQKTPQPMVGGSQTATVVGPPGELMYCDKYGRIKIQFHWDRQGKKDAKSSCWVRVSQNWGGANWGGMFIPHVGQEVIVDFEEGDPDRPLVTGRVYNAEAMPPLELPANKTQSIIRDHGANEIKLQGEDGKQSIRMYSPFAGTIFKMGAQNDLFEGFFQKTEAAWNATVDGLGDFFFGQTYTINVVGNHTTVIESSKYERVRGLKDIFIGGIKHEMVVGASLGEVFGGKTELLAPFGVKIHKGWQLNRSPKTIELNKALKAENDDKLIKKINDEIGKYDSALIEKINSHVREVKTALDKIGSMTLQVRGTLKKLLGPLQVFAKTVDEDISGLKKLVAGSIEYNAKGRMIIKASPGVTIQGNLHVTKNVSFSGQMFDFGGVFKAKK